MQNTNGTGTFTTADAQELKAICEAIFAEWYPHHRPGDPIPPMPPIDLQREARELRLRHQLAEARRRRVYAA